VPKGRLVQALRWLSRSIRRYLATFRAVLDFADVDPNPARDNRVKLRREDQAVVDPPTAAAVDTIIATVPARWRLALRTLEQTGMRCGRAPCTCLGRRRRSGFTLPDQEREDSRRAQVGGGFRVAHSGDRSNLRSRGSHSRAASLPWLHARRGEERHGASVQDGRDRPSPPARPETPLRLGTDRSRRSGYAGRSSAWTFAKVVDFGYVLARPDRRLEA
jgi:hypothetical protein